MNQQEPQMSSRSPSRVLLFLSLLVLSTTLVRAQECEYEDCDEIAEPEIGDPDMTQPPLPTPKNKRPKVKAFGSGIVATIGCANPGSSSSAFNVCPAADITTEIVLRNNGRTNMVISFLLPNGSTEDKYEVRPGLEQALETCIGHRWIVQSTCGDCMAVFDVLDTEPELVEVSNDGIEASCPGPQGRWTAPRTWASNLVAAGLANVPGTSRVLGFSAMKAGSFNRKAPPPAIPNADAFVTQVELYDYKTDSFIEKDLQGHNMFCAAITLLPDGKLFAQGGGRGGDGRFVSTYDPFDGPTGKWTRHTNTNNGHWYGTVVVTKEQRLLLALGVDTQAVGFKDWARILDFPELSQGFDFSLPWQNMTGVDLDGKQPDNLHWYPVLHLMPNGDILESGTMNNMWKIKTTGSGSISFAGKRNQVRDEKESWGASTIMFDEGKLLTIGGIENWVNNQSPNRFVYKRGFVIDMNNPNDITTKRTEDLSYQRAFVNQVVLPSGEVVAIGGKNNIKQWDDTLSVRAVELYNPLTNKWTVLAEHQAPRNYHAAAILLNDGRVLSSGGGLCGTCDETDAAGNKLNQPTSEIYSPPYLFNENGMLKQRPILQSAPATTKVNKNLRIVVTGPRAPFIDMVSIVKQSAVTHTITSDARRLRLNIVQTIRRSDTKYVYVARTNSNIDVMTPGYWFLFVLDDTGTPSIAKELKVVL